MGLQKYDEALQAFQTVIRKDSTFWQAYLKSGQIHLRLNRYAEALNALKKAYGLKTERLRCQFYAGTNIRIIRSAHRSDNLLEASGSQ